MTGLPGKLVLLFATVRTLVMNNLSNALPLFGNSTQEVSDSLPNSFVPAGQADNLCFSLSEWA